MPTKKTTPDIILMILTFSLLAIGFIMVYSASAIWADYKFDDSFFFAKRQMLFAGVGIIAMFFIMNIDYWTWRTWSKGYNHYLLCVTLTCVNSRDWECAKWVRSWIGIGAFSIQPSEFMKLAMIAFLAKFLSERAKIYYLF